MFSAYLLFRLKSLIPRVPTLILQATIIPLIPFFDFPFRFLQIANKPQSF